jgi:hypothetical protein
MKNMRSHMMMMYALAMMARGIGEDVPALPRLPELKPEGYGVHLSKAERRGKTPAELQRMRAERRNKSGGMT